MRGHPGHPDIPSDGHSVGRSSLSTGTVRIAVSTLVSRLLSIGPDMADESLDQSSVISDHPSSPDSLDSSLLFLQENPIVCSVARYLFPPILHALDGESGWAEVRRTKDKEGERQKKKKKKRPCITNPISSCRRRFSDAPVAPKADWG